MTYYRIFPEYAQIIPVWIYRQLFDILYLLFTITNAKSTLKNSNGRGETNMGNHLTNRWNQLERRYKVAFIGTFIIGILTHMYMFTNKLPNHDYPYNIHGNQFVWPLTLGRWFLEPATVISSHFYLSWVNGLLSVVYIAVAAAFIISIFRIRNTVPILLCGGLLVTWPAFADTMGFMFLADGFMLSLLFTCIAVWIWENRSGTKSYLLFPVLIGVATGIYQAYLTFAMYLILIRIILDIMEKRYSDNIELFRKIGSALLGGIFGVGFYYGMQLAIMKLAGSSFSDYMGISSAGLPDIRTLLITLWEDTIHFVELFVGSNGEFTFYEILNIIFILSFISMYIYMIIKTKLYRNRIQLFVFVLFNLLLIPVAYLWDFLSEDVVYRFMMLYCVVLLYVLAVVIADRYLSAKFSNLYMYFMIAVIFNFGLIDNIGYFNLNLCWEETYATAIQMQDRLQQLDGYEDTDEILVIGTLRLKNNNRREWVTDRIPPMIGLEAVNLMRNQDFIVSILKNDLGMVLDGVSGEQKEELMQSDEVKEMGNWPAKDSVRMVDGVMVMKLEEME